MMKPTCLYIKQHKITGLMYFGKTTKSDVVKYKGSGKYWIRHLNKHGYNVETLWISELFLDEALLIEFAEFFSETFNIVESDKWANIKPENGLDGAPIGNAVTQETKDKISKSLVGRPSIKSKYEMKEDAEIRSQRYRNISAGTIWVNNGLVSKRVKEIPEGWLLGRLKSNNIGDKKLGSKNSNGNNTRGKVIYNNGIQHAFYVEGTQPEGWVRGKMDGFQGGTGAMKKGKTYGK